MSFSLKKAMGFSDVTTDPARQPKHGSKATSPHTEKKNTKVLILGGDNKCRSAMATHYLQHLVESNKLPIEVASRGIHLLHLPPHQAATNAAVTALMNEGISTLGSGIGSHEARQMNEDDANEADVILVMCEQQKKDLLGNFPNTKSKIRLLLSYTRQGPDLDIASPAGASQEAHDECLRAMIPSLQAVASSFTSTPARLRRYTSKTRPDPKLIQRKGSIATASLFMVH